MSNETLILVALIWSGLSYIASNRIAGLLSYLVIGDTVSIFYPKYKIKNIVLAIKEVKPEMFWLAYIGYYVASFAINAAMICLGLTYFNTFQLQQISPTIFTLMFIGGRLLLIVILDIRSLLRNKDE